ncbi:FGGY-family carbohydrate kinase [soil metagenome]
MALVAGLDLGGGNVKACVVECDTGAVLALAEQATETLHPGPGRAEFDPAGWWLSATQAMRAAVARAGRPGIDYGAVTVTSLRQGYVLLGAESEIGPGVVNADRRGATQLERLAEVVGPERLYEVTGHWSAPQLTLPKLLEEQRATPGRWDRVETILFVHDWAIWRMCGERSSEPSIASAGQLLDVGQRTWATGLLADLGLDPGLLPPLVDAGTTIGRLRADDLGLPLDLPVVVGGGDTQMAAAGAGGLADGAVSVVAGTTTPVQASTSQPAWDPERHPWVSAHLVPGRWAAETNAGYPGLNLDWLAAVTGSSVADLADEAAGCEAGAGGVTAVVAAGTWSEEAWSSRSPNVLVGFEPRHGRAHLARAFIEAHAYAIRSNLEDLERAIGRTSSRVSLLGGAARSPAFTQLVADVTGRAIGQVDSAYPAGRAFAWLASLALEGGADPPVFAGRTVEPSGGEPSGSGVHEEGYLRFLAAGETVRSGLAGWMP